MSDLNNEIGNITSAIEHLENSLKKRTSFMHSTPKIGTNAHESDSGVETALQTNPLRSDEAGRTVIFGARSKVTSENGISTNSETLPYSNSLDRNSDDKQGHISQPPSTNMPLSNSRNSNLGILVEENQKSTRDSSSEKKNPNQGVKIKPATYNGGDSWIDYKSHFDMVSKVNDWSHEQMGLYLAVSLRGQAQGILGDLSTEVRSDYDSLVVALEERFAPPSQTELYRVQFRERRKKATESLPELGQVFRRLSNLAYPTAPRDVRETLALEQFIDSLYDSDMRLKIKQSRPKSLDEAVKLSVELEAFNKAEESNKAHRGYLRSADYNSKEEGNEPIPVAAQDTNTAVEKLEQGMQSIQNMIKELTIEMGKLKDAERSRNNLTNDKKCYNCGKSGHFVRECPERKPYDNSFHRGRGGGYNRRGRGDRYQNPSIK
ncbi:Hypothetical predicted protein [Mytilus galloprovincialis]|uniref:CCHC-type domain-containing protein n=1 Tax=Mytilus galloprovincialis TaxID=29158 RepID=A0A8B6GNR9_MYTGA|nr:Hypothetical predicted protein [Mytilus galloprovincialis]